MRDPSGYPLLSFIESLKRNSPDNPLISQSSDFKICGTESGKLIGFASIIDSLQGSFTAWGLTDARQPIGLALSKSDGDVIQLLSLYVVPETRGAGWGTKLLDALGKMPVIEGKPAVILNDPQPFGGAVEIRV